MDIDKPDYETDHERDLRALEARAAAWRPSRGALDRDRMLFEAGHAAARAEARAWSWRLATAALALVSAGLGGALVQERTMRRALEVKAAYTAPAIPSAASRALAASPHETSTPALEPPGPSSYFALTVRLDQGLRDLSSPDLDFEPEPHRPMRGPSGTDSDPGSVRPLDTQHVLEF
jgi:hypothetical protein